MRRKKILPQTRTAAGFPFLKCEKNLRAWRRKTMKKIGFIGVGIMGKSMVKNLMKAGFELHIYARTKSKVNDVIEEGAICHETIG